MVQRQIKWIRHQNSFDKRRCFLDMLHYHFARMNFIKDFMHFE